MSHKTSAAEPHTPDITCYRRDCSVCSREDSARSYTPTGDEAARIAAAVHRDLYGDNENPLTLRDFLDGLGQILDRLGQLDQCRVGSELLCVTGVPLRCACVVHCVSAHHCVSPDCSDAPKPSRLDASEPTEAGDR